MPGIRRNPEVRERVIRLRQEGKSLDDVVSITGVPKRTIGNWTERMVFEQLQAKDFECSVEGCTKPCRCKGLCNAHYQRSFRPPPMDPFEKARMRLLRDSILTTTGCREWQGASSTHSRSGLTYGTFHALGEIMVHRVSYRAFVGPISEGLHIDHTCSNTLCVEPAHLEPVTVKENSRRTWARGRGHSRSKMNSNNTLEFWEWVCSG